MLLLPEPVYAGPENICFFKGEDLEEEIRRDKQIVWLVELYTAWSPPCIDFSNIYSELSNKYSLDNLRFAKVDLARNPDTATKYKINTSTLSQQLPTLILFQNGKETMRRPVVNNNNKLVKFVFSYVSLINLGDGNSSLCFHLQDNVVREYELNDIYNECKKNPLKRENKKTN